MRHIYKNSHKPVYVFSIRHVGDLLLLRAGASPLLAQPPNADCIRELARPRGETVLDAYRALRKTRRVKGLQFKLHRDSVQPGRAHMRLIQYGPQPRDRELSTQDLPDTGAPQKGGRVTWRKGCDDRLETWAAAASFVPGSRLVLASWCDQHTSSPFLRLVVA